MLILFRLISPDQFTHTVAQYKPGQSKMKSDQWSSDPPPPFILLLSVLSQSLSLPLQCVVCLPVSPSLPPITRWCPVAASTWPALRLVLPCLMSSGWAARWSWPGRRRCRLDVTSWSSPTSGSLPTTPVWPYPPWAWSRPRPRSLSKVRSTLCWGLPVCIYTCHFFCPSYSISMYNKKIILEKEIKTSTLSGKSTIYIAPLWLIHPFTHTFTFRRHWLQCKMPNEQFLGDAAIHTDGFGRLEEPRI